MYDKVLFVAFIFLIAYILKIYGVFKEEHSKTFIDYVIYFSLPALVIQKIREVGVSGDSAGVVLIAWSIILISILISLFIGKFLKLEDKSMRAFVLVSSFGNTAFMGYPFTFAFFGDEGLRYAVLYDQLGSFLLVISLGFFVATGRFSIKEVLIFPPLLALIFGFLIKEVELHPVIHTFLDVSGKSLIPVVLFAIGLKFSPSHIFDSIKGASLALFIKMFLAPLIVFVFLKAFSFSSLNYKVAFLETAMPPMVMAGVLAIKYGLDEKLAVSAITLGIILSFFTVPFFLSFF